MSPPGAAVVRRERLDEAVVVERLRQIGRTRQLEVLARIVRREDLVFHGDILVDANGIRGIRDRLNSGLRVVIDVTVSIR